MSHARRLAVSVELANPYWFYPRVVVQRQTCRHAQPSPTQPALFQCADGRCVYFALILADPKPWTPLVAWMVEPASRSTSPSRSTPTLAYRQANFAHIQELVEVFFLLQDADDVYHDGQARGLPIGIANAPEELFDDEHLAARGFFVTVEHDDAPPGMTPVRRSASRRYDPLPTGGRSSR